MVSLLARLFIKENTTDKRSAYGVLCGIVGIVLNLILFGAKLLAGSLSGSIAITADAFNNLSDSGSSIITLVGFKLAAQKPDSGHPFGHGRIEYISGLFVSLAILLMAFELLKTSIEKIITPQPVEFSYLAVAILVFSIGVKLYMYLYNKRIGKKINSAAMLATATDSLSDCCATTAVLAATTLSNFTSLNLDPYFGLLVAVFIGFSGLKAAVETISPLLGTAPDPQLVSDITELVLQSPTVIGMHDLVVHDYGPSRMMISLHAEVPARCDFLEAHDEIDLLERQLSQQFNCHCVIHLDPIANDDEQSRELFATVISLATAIDKRLSIHDFRTVRGTTHTNLIFDLIVPYELEEKPALIKAMLEKSIAELDGSYNAVINAERSFIH